MTFDEMLIGLKISARLVAAPDKGDYHEQTCIEATSQAPQESAGQKDISA